MLAVVLLLFAPAEGRPLFYWGARPPVIAVAAPAGESSVARVVEVHAASDKGAFVVRFSFDRPVAQALRLPDGTPVSGRLSAVLYLDTDDDRRSGLAQGASDVRTGAERRLEIGAIALGEDAEERREPTAVVGATLWSLTSDGRRRTLWRADDEGQPREVSARGEWIEVRIPLEPLGLGERARLVLAGDGVLADGRLEP